MVRGITMRCVLRCMCIGDQLRICAFFRMAPRTEKDTSRHERQTQHCMFCFSARAICFCKIANGTDTRAGTHRVTRRARLLPEPRGLHPLCGHIPSFPEEGLSHAMAFDGELYDKPAFFAYYGDAAIHVWNECQVRTHAAACFVHILVQLDSATGRSGSDALRC